MSGWPDAVRTIGAAGLHFHDLRHTGNQFAANSGAALKDLMARMGHDSERAALICQNTRREEQTRGLPMRSTRTSRSSRPTMMTMGQPVGSCPSANGPLMARTVCYGPRLVHPGLGESPLAWAFAVERVTGIEPALSAWEAVLSELLSGLSCKKACP